MPTLPPYLTQDDAEDYTWCLGKQGYFHVFDGIGEDYDNHFDVPEYALEVLHPLLADVVRESIDWSRQCGASSEVNGEVVQVMLSVLKFGTAAFKDKDNHNFTLASVSQIQKMTTRMYEISGIAVQVHHDEWEPDIPCITYQGKTSFIVKREYLDQTYPGWKAKWLANAALDLDDSNLMVDIFTGSDTPTSTSDLPDISFN